MAREEGRGETRHRDATHHAAPDRKRPAVDEDDRDGDGDFGDERRDEARPFTARGEPPAGSEQADFREQFDEDLFTDREDRPAQGNTADVAMEHRFGSDASAYAEYAWRRSGDHHHGDASAVGQARDPADIADEDEAS